MSYIPQTEVSVLRTSYSVDFSALDSQSFDSDGNHTIDGRPWTTFNRANAQTLELVKGGGLYVKCNTNASNDADADLTGPGMYSHFSDLSPELDFARWSELWVWFQYEQPHTPNTAYEAGGVGIICLGTSYTAAQILRYSLSRGYDGSLYCGSAQVTSEGNNSQYREIGARPATDHDVFAMRVCSNAVHFYRGRSVNDHFPLPATLEFIARAGKANAVSFTPIADNWAVWFHCMAARPASGNADFRLKKMLIQTKL